MSSQIAPLRLQRLVTLFTTFAFATAGLGLSIFSLVQGMDQKNSAKSAAAVLGVSVNIDINDVLIPGYVIAVVCGLILVWTGFSFLTLLGAPALNSRLLKIEVPILAFLTLFLFAVLVPFTDRVANNSSTITATSEGQPVPPAFVIQIGQSLGIQNVYHKIGYRTSFHISFSTFFFRNSLWSVRVHDFSVPARFAPSRSEWL